MVDDQSFSNFFDLKLSKPKLISTVEISSNKTSSEFLDVVCANIGKITRSTDVHDEVLDPSQAKSSDLRPVKITIRLAANLSIKLSKI